MSAAPERWEAETPAGRLHALRWPAPGPVVVLLHGLESHAAWFAELAGRLHAAGYEVLAVDRPGSGESVGEPGDLPLHPRLVEALAAVLGQAAEGRERWCAALSWGARWALCQELARPGSFRGIALLAPGLSLRADYPLRARLRAAAGWAARRPQRFPSPVGSDAMLTTRPDALEWIAADPRRVRQVSGRFLVESWRMQRRVARGIGRLRVPVLHLMAGRDRVVDNARNRAFLRERLAPGLYHEALYGDADHSLVWECGRHPVAEDLCGWIDEQRGAGAPPTPEGVA